MPEDKERDSLTGRLSRYARVGSRVGGMAARVAGGRLLGTGGGKGLPADLRRALGGLKGPVMKVAQMLATIPEALPAEFAAELSELQANAPPMGWAFVQRRMATELGPEWRVQFATFGKDAAAAASLGQVHRATGHDDRELACKLQYPDMASAVEADLNQLQLAFALYRRFNPAIDTANIVVELGARLREELDYRLEARHMALFAGLLRGTRGVRVPEVVPELSTGRLLTMTWLHGRPMAEFEDASEAVRSTLAEHLFRAWYGPFYSAGAIHGDPHLGNYTVGDGDTLNLLDFGCIRTFRPEFVQGVIDLYTAVATKDRDLSMHAYRSWGFEHLTAPVVEALNLWAEFLYAPILDDRPRRIQEVDAAGVYGQAVATEVHRRLRAEGGVRPPREFVFMDRAAVGLGAVFLRLRAKLNWHRLFHELTDGLTVESLRARQKHAFTRAGVPIP